MSAVRIAILLAVGCAACNRAPPETEVRMEVARAPAPSVTPADHLAPGELAESEVMAFGVPFPRGAAKTVVMDDFARAEVAAP